MNKDAKVYVAGHRGLVGSAIVRQLKNEGYSNLIFSTSTDVDLRNQAAVEEFFIKEKPEYVFLAAAKVGGIHANDTYPADFIRDNLQIQTNVIDASYRHGVTKLLFLGSSCIYPKMASQPLKEEYLLTGSLEPTNEWYAIAKIAGIKMCQAYRKQYGFNAISLMPTNLYGSNDNFDLNNSHVLPALMRKFHLAKLVVANNVEAIAQDEQHFGEIPDDLLDTLGLVRNEQGLARNKKEPKVILWGTGTPKREFLHVDDLASACIFAMKSYKNEEIINVGVGEDVTIAELAGLIQRIIGYEGKVIWDPSKPNGAQRKLMDVTKLKQLGWQADIDFEQGIQKVYQNYCSFGQKGEEN